MQMLVIFIDMQVIVGVAVGGSMSLVLIIVGAALIIKSSMTARAMTAVPPGKHHNILHE